MIRLFNASIAPATFILLLFESLLLLGALVLATVAVADVDPVDYLLYDSGLIALLLVVLGFLLGLHFQDLYTDIRVKSKVFLVQQLCMVAGVAFLAEGLISYLNSDLRVSVHVMLLASAIAVPTLFLERLVFSNFAGQLVPRTRLVMIGQSPILTQLRTWIEMQPQAGLVVEGVAETLDEMSALDKTIRRQQPPRLIFAAWGKPDPRLDQEVLDLGLAGYEVESASAIYERACGRVSLFSLHPHQLIYSTAPGTAAPLSFYRVVTNGLMAGICLIVAIPAMLLTALVLRATTRGPVWHSEPMRGLNGQVFRAYTFHVNGSGVIAKCMRRLRLEELPQFLNVLKGELAMVGPRAARPEYEEAIERYIPFYRERNTVRPGVTGWAQVHLDRMPEFEDTIASLEYDLYYVKNRSFGLDSLILLHAIKSLLVSSPAPRYVWSSGG
jgi:lipopolysaccharide/colanic/teichoic acid biosynthesis glycosyltransferase